jgi:Tfp pilus assembly protein PilZ
MKSGFDRAKDLEGLYMPKAVIVSMLGIGLGAIVAMVIFWSVSKFIRKQISPNQLNQALADAQDSNWEEKRQYRRLAVSWEASMETSQGTIPVHLKDISLGGAFVVCPEPMALNEKLRITIDAPNQDPFPLQAEVVWSNVNVPDDKVVHRGMGIRFVENTTEERTQLNNALESVLEEGESG